MSIECTNNGFYNGTTSARLVLQLALGLLLRNPRQQPNLIRNVPQHAQDALVALDKRHLLVLQPLVLPQLEPIPIPPAIPLLNKLILLLDPLLNLLGDRPKPKARNTREEVVRSLEVETAVERVEVGWAGDVHCCAELAVRVGFEEFEGGGGERIGGGRGGGRENRDGLREVREDDLSCARVGKESGEKGNAQRTCTCSGLVTAKLTTRYNHLCAAESIPLNTTPPNHAQKQTSPTSSRMRSLKSGERRAGQLVRTKAYESAKRLKRAKHMTR